MAQENKLVKSIQKMLEDNVDEKVIVETLVSQGIGEEDAKTILSNAKKNLVVKVKRQVVTWLQEELKSNQSVLYSAFEKKISEAIVSELKSFTESLEKRNLKMQNELDLRMDLIDKKISLLGNNQDAVKKRLEELSLMRPKITGNVVIRWGLIAIGIAIIGFTLSTLFGLLSNVSTQAPDLNSLLVVILISVVGMFVLYVGTEMKI
ncbi:MAG: hypothetical protein J7K00_00445 [Candidatus Diapherotrites archaeon]|nr:hypothetical protein [Candidatus Diapherotrites archaeon]